MLQLNFFFYLFWNAMKSMVICFSVIVCVCVTAHQLEKKTQTVQCECDYKLRQIELYLLLPHIIYFDGWFQAFHCSYCCATNYYMIMFVGKCQCAGKICLSFGYKITNWIIILTFQAATTTKQRILWFTHVIFASQIFADKIEIGHTK